MNCIVHRQRDLSCSKKISLANHQAQEPERIHTHHKICVLVKLQMGLSQWYNNNVIEQFHQLIYRIKNFRSRWGLSTLKLIKAVEKEKKNSTNSLTIAWKHHWLKLLPSNRCIKRTYSVYIENLVHYDVQKRKEGEDLTQGWKLIARAPENRCTKRGLTKICNCGKIIRFKF